MSVVDAPQRSPKLQQWFDRFRGTRTLGIELNMLMRCKDPRKRNILYTLLVPNIELLECNEDYAMVHCKCNEQLIMMYDLITHKRTSYSESPLQAGDRLIFHWNGDIQQFVATHSSWTAHAPANIYLHEAYSELLGAYDAVLNHTPFANTKPLVRLIHSYLSFSLSFTSPKDNPVHDKQAVQLPGSHIDYRTCCRIEG